MTKRVKLAAVSSRLKCRTALALTHGGTPRGLRPSENTRGIKTPLLKNDTPLVSSNNQHDCWQRVELQVVWEPFMQFGIVQTR